MSQNNQANKNNANWVENENTPQNPKNDILVDKEGWRMTKDGFYLKDSDDELDDVQVKKSRKERKTELWIQKIVKNAAKDGSESDTDSDSSTEETLTISTANSNYGK